ncbi:MAG: nuclease-related domain-containing protein [Sulfurimicrobium sp.]|nr:nuclease-related domain-containing protein [Sulfurimicrobium sp.]
MNDIFSNMMLYVTVFPVMPLVMYAHHISQSYFGGRAETVSRTSIEVVIVLAVMIFLLFKIITLLKRFNKFRLGYEGEVAIAQELNLLMRDGAYVFHDVPAEGFNIDHVIVWPKGVYAVETKGRMKPKRDRGTEDAKVVFDGQRLQFPGWTETAPLDQATRQAKWLAQWLSSAVGDKVGVKPVLALPGWFVELKAKSDVVIINGRNAPGTFGKLFHTELSDEMIKRIAHQLEQRCRNVAPKHFHKRERITQ